MLIEEQAAELLARCERILGIELRQVRGNLRNASSRAAAVWELLVIEAAAELGSVEYEPHPGASPDIAVRINEGRRIWIEAAYLYPRFWREERQSNEVVRWILDTASGRGLPPQCIQLRFDGAPRSAAGFKRILPQLHEKREFLRNPQLVEFFHAIEADRNSEQFCQLSPYSISLAYSPKRSFYGTGGGLLQESATSVSENAAYRALELKAKQHDIAEPRVICIGSDQSPSLSSLNGPGTGRPSGTQAAQAALRKYPSISCAIIVNIKTGLGSFQRAARGNFIGNPTAREKLTDNERDALLSLDFNRWSYTFPLPKWERDDPDERFRRVSGKLEFGGNGLTMKIKIPTDVVVDALAGRRSVAEAFRLSPEELRALEEGWRIVSCTLEEGNIEAAEAPRLSLELAWPHSPIFWPKRNTNKTPR